jgi:recombinational DNA repair protein (RecF pathway)
MSFRDGTVLDDHHHLRQSLKALQTAGALANAILTSQMAGKPAPTLFALYNAYHKQVPHLNPDTLLASFYLKLLKYEGESLTLQPHHFSPTEIELIDTLENTPQFSLLHALTITPYLSQKIHTLFKSQIHSQ